MKTIDEMTFRRNLLINCFVLVVLQGNKFMQSSVMWLMLSLLLKENSMSWIIWLAMETVGPLSLVEHQVRNTVHALRA